MTSAHVIVELVTAGKRVGITANSHAVIAKLLDEVMAETSRRQSQVVAVQREARSSFGNDGRPSVQHRPAIHINPSHRIASCHEKAEPGTSALLYGESINQTVTVTDICSSLSLPDLELSWGAVTDVGKIRKLNEDDMLLAPGVFVVADGMGGHAAGDIASRLTIETFSDIVTGGAIDLSVIAGVISDANERVRDYSNSNGHHGMGCTVVGALLVDNAGENTLVVFNVGDARCYVLADDELVQLTHDHSLVQEMVDQGEIPASSARTHPQRNVVTRAVGIEPSVSADFVIAPRTSLRMLLCSDGVHGELPDERLAALLRVPSDPDTIARSIIDAVLEGRASDNATAMIIDVVRSARIEPLAPDDDLGVTGPRPGLATSFVSSGEPDAGATVARERESEPSETEVDSAQTWNDEISAPPLADPADGPPVPTPDAPSVTNTVIDSVPT